MARIVRWDEGYSIVGKIKGQYDAVINSDGEKMYAHIFGPREQYVIYPIEGGHRLERIPLSDDEPDAVVIPSVPSVARRITSKESTSGPTFIDVLVLFSPAAAAEIGTDDASLKLFSDQAVALTNTVLANSQVPDTYMRLVNWAMINRAETGNGIGELSWLTNDAGAAYLRNESGADVVLMIEETLDFSGVANEQGSPTTAFAPFAFGVIKRVNAINTLTFPHEFGHTLGMRHDPTNDALGGTPSFPWSFGHNAYRMRHILFASLL